MTIGDERRKKHDKEQQISPESRFYFLCVAMSFSVRRISKVMSRTASMVYVIKARSPRALHD